VAEHDVAAAEVGLHVLAAGLAEQVREAGHADLVATDVHAAQQRDRGLHRTLNPRR
jgi:hypothetical protein